MRSTLRNASCVKSSSHIIDAFHLNKTSFTLYQKHHTNLFQIYHSDNDLQIDDEVFRRRENDTICFIFDVLKISMNLTEFVFFDDFLRERSFHVVVDLQRVDEDLNVIVFTTIIVMLQSEKYQFFFEIELFDHF